MRVLQVVPALQLGGVERVVVALSEAVAAAGHKSFVMSRGGDMVREITEHGGEHISFDVGGKNVFTAWQRSRRLRAVLGELAPDIVHIHSRVPAWLLRFAAVRPLPYKVVSTFHGMYSVGRYSAQMARADAVICPSRASRDYVRRHYAVADARLHLVHNGVDLEKFSPQNDDAENRRQWWQQQRIDDDTVAVALVGRVSPVKGHHLFIDALAQLAKSSSPRPVVGLIVGGGVAKRMAALRAHITQLGIADRIRLVAAQQDMRAVYNAVDIVVSATSARPEAFGLTMVEALAMNRPVVASAHGGTLDIIEDGKNGYLFPPGNSSALAAAIQKAAATPWHNIRASAQKFSVTKMTDNTIQIYQQL